jgi:Fe-S-cluster-containing dehydrogenase component
MAEPLRFWNRHDLSTRRDFLTRVGFSLAATAIAGCSRAPVEKAIPFLNKPEEITPGVASWYATTCGGCASSCALLVKTRDGRPIKVEGNDKSGIFGGTCATGQGTVLSLYDGDRLRGPLWHGEATTWDDMDARVEARLAAAIAAHHGVALLSGTIVSPSTRAVIAEWSARIPGFRHVAYDAVSYSALREATRDCFGVVGVPHYRFDRARTIVGIEADFLGTWLSPVEFTRQYASRRRPESPGGLSRHYHFEAAMSLTGSNADCRVAIESSRHGLVALSLLDRISRKAGVPIEWPDGLTMADGEAIAAAAEDLWRHRGAGLVVSGSQDPAVQIVVHVLNVLLENIGTTVDVERPSLQRQGDDRAVAALVDDMSRGDVHVLMLYGVNPVYDYPDAARFARAMESVALTISFADRLDETAARANAVCPDHHYLEAWGDAEPIASTFSLAQPTIAPLFNTRAAQESLLKWAGQPADFYSYIRQVWRAQIYPRLKGSASFDAFWDSTLHDGVFEAGDRRGTAPERLLQDARFGGVWRAAAATAARDCGQMSTRASSGGYELRLHESVALRDGRHANNPWLQELPDPVTKVTWSNCASIAPSLAGRLGIATGDVVRVSIGDRSCELPAFVQPGQSPSTVSIALGYGRGGGSVSRGVGANAFPLVTMASGHRQYCRAGALVQRAGRHEALAITQEHRSMEGRPIVQSMTLDAFLHEQPEPGREQPSLWPARETGEHRWGMVVDLNACTGCSACVTACQAENNVPVVGRDEVRRSREMHWLRIDSYVDGPEDAPEISVQPMMCQHCDNAPCETVCPVLATVHSADGINQQIYNRCIGTRYCENNCPYKVRRFNWFQYAGNERFDYTMRDPLERMVLNPDVVVRSRGVMEKCSLCVQRIQAGKLEAAQDGRPLADGDIKTACQQSCPAEAIVFGDLNDPDSRVSRLRAGRRYYRVLDELGTRPGVGYLRKVRNPPEAD